MHANPHDWIIPDWPVPAGVRALCTTRAGGVSTAPWDSCNLGDHVGDATTASADKGARLVAAAGEALARLIVELQSRPAPQAQGDAE